MIRPPPLRLGADPGEEGERLVGREVADARAGIEEHRPLVAEQLGRQLEPLREVLAQPGHRDLRLLALQLAQRVAQEVDRDVDRDVARRLEQRKQRRRLGAVAGAEIDQRHARADRVGDRGAVGGEDRRLGARRVVLGQLGDRLEQMRAEPVVEELGRDAGVLGRRARRAPPPARRSRRRARSG